MNTTITAFAFAALLVAGSTPALAEPTGAMLGMSLAEAREAYPTARELLSKNGEVSLELDNIEFADSRWQTADFIFDTTRHLQRVQLTTHSETYDHLRERIASQAAKFLNPTGGAFPVMMFTNTMQMRICDRGDAGVFLTYERPSKEI